MSRVAVELAMRPAGDGTIVNVTLSPHHGFAGMAHSSTARAAVEGFTKALAREWAPDGIAVLALAAGHFDTAVMAASTRRTSAAQPPARCRSGASDASPSTRGWSRSPPRRSAARSPARSSRSTAPATTGSARGRPRHSLDDAGAVPTEERRPSA